MSYDSSEAQAHLDELEDELGRVLDARRMTEAGFTNPNHFAEWQRLEQIRRTQLRLTRECVDGVRDVLDGGVQSLDGQLEVAMPRLGPCACRFAAGCAGGVDRVVVPTHESSPSVRDDEGATSSSDAPTVGDTADTSAGVPSGSREAGGRGAAADAAAPHSPEDDASASYSPFSNIANYLDIQKRGIR